MRIKIYWANEQDKKKAGFGMKRLIKKSIRTTLICENFMRNVIVSVTFTDNEGIREKNRAFRDIDSATDVLSFPMYDMRNGDLPEETANSEISYFPLKEQRSRSSWKRKGRSTTLRTRCPVWRSVLPRLSSNVM